MKTTKAKSSGSFFPSWLASIVSISLLIPQLLFAQGGVGIGTDDPDDSAILHIQPYPPNKGLLIPRLADPTQISNAANGLLVFNTTTNQFMARIGTEWLSLNTLISTGTDTSNAYIITSGLIGLGTAPAAGGAKVQVAGSISATGAVTTTGTVTASSFVGQGIVPAYGIIMWHGNLGSIPTGWWLCDGTNGTPDLRERFIVGASGEDNGTVAGAPYPRNTVGGFNSVALTLEQMPRHTHRFRSGGDRGPGGSGREPASWTGNLQPNVHTVEEVGGVLVPELLGVDNSGYPCTGGPPWARTPAGCNTNYGNPIILEPAHYATAAHENRPPYYALAFIMKLP